MLVTPFSCLTLWSFDETAICAWPGAAARPKATQTPVMMVFRMAFLLACPLDWSFGREGKPSVCRARAKSLSGHAQRVLVNVEQGFLLGPVGGIDRAQR